MKRRKPYNNQAEFDEHIKDMFQNFKAPYNPASWDDLSQKMDNSLPFAIINDDELKSDLSNLTMPYNPGSWKILEERLDLYETRKKWILKGKFIEMAMFFIVFYLFTGSIDKTFDLIQQKNEIAVNNSNSVSQTNSNEIVADTNLYEATPSISSDQNSESPDPVKTTDVNPSNTKRVRNIKKSKIKSASALNGNEVIPTEQSEQPAPVVIISAQEIESPVEEYLQENASGQYWTTLSDENLIDTPEFPIEKLSHKIPQIEQENIEQNDLILPVLYPGNFNDQKLSLLIGVVIGYDKDLIKSPFPHQKSEVMLGRIEDNFRAGLNLSIEMNAFEISTGLHYLIKNYTSVYAGENQVRIAHIPIMLKLKLPFAGFMRGYVAGGVSGNYVIHANYAEHDYFRDRPQLDYIENNSRAAGYSLLSSSNYKNGIFEGETIRGNHFYTANIAIGLEAHLNKSYSLFFEQAYSHHLKGSAIGPAFDHFFSSTTLLGFRYRILKNSNKILHSNKMHSIR